jgi:hypothetical protein
MGRMNAVLAAAMAVVACASSGEAQTAAELQALGNQIEQRFDVLPVRDGVVLRPKDDSRGVRSIQLTGGAISIDGEPVTGAELRRRLDADADLILRLSYLETSAQRALFEPRDPVPPPVPAGPASPTPPEAVTPPADPAPPTEPGPRRRGRSSDRVRIGGGVRVGTDEVINGDVVAIGGDANVGGQVRGDAVAIFGDLELGPGAGVDGDAIVIGGMLRRDPGARVGGEIHEIGLGDVNFGGWWRWPFMGGMPGPMFGSAFGSLFALVSTGTRLAIYCILACFVLLFSRGYVERIGVRAASEPLKAGAVGFLIQLLFFPVLVASIVLMVITIIGIPLLVLVPFALLAFALLCFVGFTAVTYDVGRLAAARFGGDGQNPYLVAAIGVAVLLSPVLLSRLIGFGGPILWPITGSLLLLGLLIEYAVWTVGLGAVALLKFDRRLP